MLLVKHDPLFQIIDQVFKIGEEEKFSPKANFYEDKEKYSIEIDLPGVKKEDVNIEIIDDFLVISGERKYEKKESSYRIESYYGQFTRKFMLPKNIDTEKIEAKFQKGVLKISLPKKEINSQKISVKD
jgi:HSP20 family protein